LNPRCFLLHSAPALKRVTLSTHDATFSAWCSVKVQWTFSDLRSAGPIQDPAPSLLCSLFNCRRFFVVISHRAISPPHLSPFSPRPFWFLHLETLFGHLTSPLGLAVPKNPRTYFAFPPSALYFFFHFHIEVSGVFTDVCRASFNLLALFFIVCSRS